MAADNVEIANIALNKIGVIDSITSLSQSGSNEAAAINKVYDDVLDDVLAEHPWSFAQKRIALTNTVPDDVSRTIDDTQYTPVTITGATQADPVVITAAVHGLSDGDWIKITSVVGMTELNGNFYIVANATTNTFELTDTDGEDVDGSEFTAYSSGGSIQKAIDMPAMENETVVVYEKPSDIVKVTAKSVDVAVLRVEKDKIISDTTSLKIRYTFRNTTTTDYFAKFVHALATRLAAEVCFPITHSVSKAEELLKYYHDIALPQAISSDSTQGTPQEAMQDEWLDARLTSGGYATTGETWHPA